VPAIKDVATITVAGAPRDESLTDAWLVWRRARSDVADQHRKEPGSCEQRTLDGVPGWLWTGSIAEIRRALWGPGQPRGNPYTPHNAGDDDQVQDAAAAFRNVHAMATEGTGAMIMARDHKSARSLWWVADEFPAARISRARYEELRELARGTLPPPPQPAGAIPPAARRCRYHLTGCDYADTSPQAVYSHEETGPAHAGHRIPLRECPVCGLAFASTQARSLHLNRAHDTPASSLARAELDARQTQALQLRVTATPATTPPDPDVALALAQSRAGRQPGHEDPVPVPEHPAVTGVRQLLAEHDQMRLRIADLEQQCGDKDTRLALAREALAQVRDSLDL
jgi:hypothetical protein